MTTGRINQVAFLGDTTTHTTPDADETRCETGEEVVFIEHEQLEMGGRRGGGPRAGITFGIRKHERSHVGQFGGSLLDWNTGAAARLAPRPQGGARLRGTASHSNSTEVGTQHRNPASPQGTQGLGLRVMGAASRQFGAPTRSLPTRTARLPLMRLCVHATTIPTSEPRPREQVETPERDGARTAGREGSRRDKQQAAGGTRWGQSCGGLSAPARKTEARPRQLARHATRSGMARRGNTWARARQFNATPTPA